MQEFKESQLQQNPYIQFENWYNEAIDANLFESSAMSLSTAFANGRTSVRIVLLKEFDHSGFYFFTNYNSKKGQQISQNPNASLLFYWPQMNRQIRIEGRVEMVSESVSDAYFDSRSRESRIGACASDQSSIIPNRAYLEDRVIKARETFEDNIIQRPPHWGGYKLIPNWFEFWQERDFRLHDRFEYLQNADKWIINRLAP